MSTRRPILFLAIAAALASSPALAADEVPVDVKEAIAYFDKYAPKAKDEHRYAELVSDLASTEHAAAAERIGKIAEFDKVMEHVLIAADALAEFKRFPEAREAAGKAVLKIITKGNWDDEPDVLIAAVDSIGKLEFGPGVVPTGELLLKSSDPWLQVRCVRALGDCKDLRALPFLLQLLERYPAGFSWEGGEVNVDTGTAGDGDQKEAERQYQAKYGGQTRGGKPPVMFRAWIQEIKRAIAKITKDDTVNSAADLRKWMESRREELQKLGIEIPRYKGNPKKDEEDPAPKK